MMSKEENVLGQLAILLLSVSLHVQSLPRTLIPLVYPVPLYVFFLPHSHILFFLSSSSLFAKSFLILHLYSPYLCLLSYFLFSSFLYFLCNLSLFLSLSLSLSLSLPPSLFLSSSRLLSFSHQSCVRLFVGKHREILVFFRKKNIALDLFNLMKKGSFSSKARSIVLTSNLCRDIQRRNKI